ncbi:unnamed protein product [Amoebophrya sp. A25]|nr:unnamed protein product [Amoebophrya sp. A25]|eukprot:GSA25T00013898001.1
MHRPTRASEARMQGQIEMLQQQSATVQSSKQLADGAPPGSTTSTSKDQIAKDLSNKVREFREDLAERRNWGAAGKYQHHLKMTKGQISRKEAVEHDHPELAHDKAHHHFTSGLRSDHGKSGALAGGASSKSSTHDHATSMQSGAHASKGTGHAADSGKSPLSDSLRDIRRMRNELANKDQSRSGTLEQLESSFREYFIGGSTSGRPMQANDPATASSGFSESEHKQELEKIQRQKDLVTKWFLKTGNTDGKVELAGASGYKALLSSLNGLKSEVAALVQEVTPGEPSSGFGQDVIDPEQLERLVDPASPEHDDTSSPLHQKLLAGGADAITGGSPSPQMMEIVREVESLKSQIEEYFNAGGGAGGSSSSFFSSGNGLLGLPLGGGSTTDPSILMSARLNPEIAGIRDELRMLRQEIAAAASVTDDKMSSKLLYYAEPAGASTASFAVRDCANGRKKEQLSSAASSSSSSSKKTANVATGKCETASATSSLRRSSKNDDSSNDSKQQPWSEEMAQVSLREQQLRRASHESNRSIGSERTTLHPQQLDSAPPTACDAHHQEPQWSSTTSVVIAPQGGAISRKSSRKSTSSSKPPPAPPSITSYSLVAVAKDVGIRRISSHGHPGGMSPSLGANSVSASRKNVNVTKRTLQNREPDLIEDACDQQQTEAFLEPARRSLSHGMAPTLQHAEDASALSHSRRKVEEHGLSSSSSAFSAKHYQEQRHLDAGIAERHQHDLPPYHTHSAISKLEEQLQAQNILGDDSVRPIGTTSDTTASLVTSFPHSARGGAQGTQHHRAVRGMSRPEDVSRVKPDDGGAPLGGVPVTRGSSYQQAFSFGQPPGTQHLFPAPMGSVVLAGAGGGASVCNNSMPGIGGSVVGVGTPGVPLYSSSSSVVGTPGDPGQLLGSAIDRTNSAWRRFDAGGTLESVGAKQPQERIMPSRRRRR